MYRPPEAAQMTTPLILQIPTQAEYNGVRYPTAYTDAAGVIFANFKTYGGTESVVDGILQIIETADVCCWYRPDIQSNCRIKRATDGAIFEILGDPENIEQRNQFIKMKLRRVRGGA